MPIVQPDHRPVAQVIRALRIVPGAPIMAVRKKRRQHAKPHAVLHEALMIRDVLRDDVDLLAVWVLRLVGIPAGSDGWVCEAAAQRFDVLTANNHGAYRDMWALRASALLMDYDCFWDFTRMKTQGNWCALRLHATYSR